MNAVLRIAFLFAAVFSMPVVSKTCAQNHKIDSLKYRAAFSKDSVERYKNYYYVATIENDRNPAVGALYADSAHSIALALRKEEWLCRTYQLKGLAAQKKNDLVQAMSLYDLSLENAQKFQNREVECFTLVNMAAVCMESGDINNAIKHYKTFKEKLPTPTPELLKYSEVTVQVGLSLAYKNQNRLPEAAAASKQGLELAIQYGIKQRIWDFYDNLGLIYGRMGDYKSKLEYQRKALANVSSNDPNMAVVLNNLANAFLNLNQLDSAEYYYLKVAQSPQTKWKSLVHGYNGLSQVNFQRGKYSEAQAWSEKSVPLADKTGNAMTIVSTKIHLAKSMMGLKKYDEAIQTFNALLALMDANKNYTFFEERSKAQKYLAQAIALKQGAPQVAELIDDFSKGRDSIHNFELYQAIESFRLKFETRQKEDSIRILHAEKALQQNKVERYQISLFGGMLLAVSSIGALFYFLRKRRLERDILQIQNDQLHAENAGLFERVKQYEQSAQTRTLHDFANESIVLNGKEKTVFRIGDIYYIQSQGNGLQVITPEGRSWRWQTMSNLETALPTPPFLRVHRSFMINGMHIRQYKANQLTLANGDSIPVGITQTPHVEAFLRQWLPELA